ncbi:14368_t:CDS:2 [Entrophospora sp. SA101]|nr:1153_t:CDS:2 [Entrophospora sp. SA101]CAJ0761722.1 14368_t:CDS:2 [Entrophospora sp. SA101]CAJ0849960.1 536_t:CDS:2 [Entrophospora sp. SA101]CAJ0881128.1 7560_t:CDS:2 [Entrophospora sp. SA101]
MNDTNGKKIAYYNLSVSIKGSAHLKLSKEDHLKFLTKNLAIPILPHPPQSSNKDNCVISLNNFVQWLGDQAEAENVELYVNFAGSEVLYNQDGSVRGVATNDMGLDKNFKPKSNFE